MHEPSREFLNNLKAEGLHRSLKNCDWSAGPVIRVDGKICVNFSSNNYLGLADHPRLKGAAAAAAKEFGCGAGASRLLAGHHPLAARLEEMIAAFKGTDASLLFSSGYLANVGALPALTSPNGLVLLDRLSHASLVDGCRLACSVASASLKVYRHRDSKQVERLLAGRKTNRPALVVTDGVFSMDGDLAPLGEILKSAEQYDALVYLDDAHGTGVVGEKGGGTPDLAGIGPHPRLIQMGTLSKALGSLGGFIAADWTVIDLLINRARAFIYTTALPPPVLAASIAAFDLLKDEGERRRGTLAENRRRLISGLSQIGVPVQKSEETPIVPIPIGEASTALLAAERLREAGFYLPAIRPPTVPRGKSRLRISLMATHTAEQIDGLVGSLARIL